MISEKKISCRVIFRGKKSRKEILGKKYPARKKISLMSYNIGKNLTLLYVGSNNYVSRGLREKLFKQTKSNNPPLKVKWFTLNAADTTIQLSRGFPSTLR